MPQQQLQGIFDRLAPHGISTARESCARSGRHNGPTALSGYTEADRADRLRRCASVRSRDSADRNGGLDPRSPQTPSRHLPDGWPAHRAEARQRSRRNAEHSLFRLVRVGDVSAIEPLRAAGRIGEHLGNPSRRARLGRRDAQARAKKLPPDSCRQTRQRRIIHMRSVNPRAPWLCPAAAASPPAAASAPSRRG
jgi:hypothetical protein